MAAIAQFLDEVVLTGSTAEGPVQAWDVRTGMQLKSYKCVCVCGACVVYCRRIFVQIFFLTIHFIHFSFSPLPLSSPNTTRVRSVAREVRLETDVLFVDV